MQNSRVTIFTELYMSCVSELFKASTQKKFMYKRSKGGKKKIKTITLKEL